MNLAGGKPLQERGPREAPVAADTAPRKLSRIGQGGDLGGVDLQQRRGLVEREHVGRWGRAEVVPAEGELWRVLLVGVVVEVALDERGHELALGDAALAGMRIELPESLTDGEVYPPLCLLAAVGLAPLAAAPGLAAMVALAFVAGACFAPISICQLAIIRDVAPPARTAEAFTWLGTLYGAGLAAGAALAGQLIAAADPRLAIAAACAATAAAWLVATFRAGTLVPAVSARSAPP